jgi:serine/threonine protein kinase
MARPNSAGARRSDQTVRFAGRYALFDQIAAGGMGTVHLGRLTASSGFQRVVAIKRALPEVMADPELAGMFVDEALASSSVQHPNVLSALDLVDADGEIWLVMEYVHGAALGSLIRLAAGEGGVPLRVACAVSAGMLRGLHAAHEAKSATGVPLRIIHRDVSPQNVLIGCDGLARVIDFGVAKAIGQRHRTTIGQIKGKLSYLAPERLTGAAPDRRIDIFAAAIVLWEMLTGNKLFQGKDDAEIVRQVLFGVIRSPRELNADVPPALANVVMRGLHADPALRFQTALEMAQALEQSTQLASHAETGAWVGQTAQEQLNERTRQLAELEATATEGGQHEAGSDVRPTERRTVPILKASAPGQHSPWLGAGTPATPPTILPTTAGLEPSSYVRRHTTSVGRGVRLAAFAAVCLIVGIVVGRSNSSKWTTGIPEKAPLSPNAMPSEVHSTASSSPIAPASAPAGLTRSASVAPATSNREPARAPNSQQDATASSTVRKLPSFKPSSKRSTGAVPSKPARSTVSEDGF